METIQLIGIAASIGTGISLLPQLVKIIREKKAENVSMPMLAVLFMGLVLWVIYGILKKDWIIIGSNALSLLLNACTVIFSLKYKQ
ncbi:SemiSWEET transporter [Paraflavitalea sp. CAU 1676]|uniref:SemiSWEET family sugar transporter n=1 Tax=Paraflavitalea sp. CAU 1676 TaxID=3032598 RepID=UPI0023D9BCC2|nr:SemiSWEET transporter [Paraflavitalea sp. CAU 1676]MDF2192155.1 SemiSWEET transporter [Paraflavitalea sp. CAU 1676]